MVSDGIATWINGDLPSILDRRHPTIRGQLAILPRMPKISVSKLYIWILFQPLQCNSIGIIQDFHSHIVQGIVSWYVLLHGLTKNGRYHCFARRGSFDMFQDQEPELQHKTEKCDVCIMIFCWIFIMFHDSLLTSWAGAHIFSGTFQIILLRVHSRCPFC